MERGIGERDSRSEDFDTDGRNSRLKSGEDDLSDWGTVAWKESSLLLSVFDSLPPDLPNVVELIMDDGTACNSY